MQIDRSTVKKLNKVYYAKRKRKEAAAAIEMPRRLQTKGVTGH